jgi:NTP pyrophosphatase (non-canonical NTP hydrolase)
MSDTFYGRFVKDMFKDELKQDEVALYIERFGVLHAAVGVAGEAGEILDEIKKVVFTGRNLYLSPLDNIIKELGDLEFYLEALRQQLQISRDEVLNNNWRKLSERHGDNEIEDYYRET